MEDLITILEITKWPIVVLILILFFYRPIAKLINRIRGFNGGSYGFDAEPTTNQQETDKLLKAEELKIGTIEKSLNLFSEETRKMFQESILLETEIDKIKDEKEKVEAFRNYSEALYSILHFERIYSNIFGSQIKLLAYLNSAFNETTSSVKFFYDNAAKNNPEMLKYPYEKYLEFLEIKNLVQITNDSIQITWLGRDFLKFMMQMGLSDLKNN